jgi:hypothetical protein
VRPRLGSPFSLGDMIKILLLTVGAVLAVPIALFMFFSVLFGASLTIQRMRLTRKADLATESHSLQVVDGETSQPMPGVMLWVKYHVSAGLLLTESTPFFGPYFTDSNGCLTVPVNHVSVRVMRDGSVPVKPSFYWTHSLRGMYMSSFDKETPASFVHRWSQPDDIQASYRLLNHFLPDELSIMLKYITATLPPRVVAQQSAPGDVHASRGRP